MRPLALHQITAMEAGPVGLVDIAAATGCSDVCVFVHSPADSRAFPMATQENKAALLARKRDTGVGISNVEYFQLHGDADLAAFRAPLALGAALGARLAVTHIHDKNPGRAAATLDAFCVLAAEYDLMAGLEFMGLTPGCTSLGAAVRFVDQLARPNLAIAVDALHLTRTGGTPADVAALPASYFAYAQICDGRGLHRATDYLPEALDRLAPGDGDFPLAALVEALPAATPLDVEVPSIAWRKAGLSALARAERAVQATRTLLDSAKPWR